jgi:hypothetical protein
VKGLDATDGRNPTVVRDPRSRAAHDGAPSGMMAGGAVDDLLEPVIHGAPRIVRGRRGGRVFSS